MIGSLILLEVQILILDEGSTGRMWKDVLAQVVALLPLLFQVICLLPMGIGSPTSYAQFEGNHLTPSRFLFRLS